MGRQVALNHRTEYRYDRAISLGPHVIQLRPAFHCKTPILSYTLDVTPAAGSIHWQLDPLNNRLARVIFPNKTSELIVNISLIADLSPYNPFDFLLEPSAAEHPFAYSADLHTELQPYLTQGTNSLGPLLRGFVNALPSSKTATVSILLDLNRKVRDAVRYEVRMEHGVQSSEETLKRQSGSCRDSAWLLVETMRAVGVAARFVSGYLIQLAAEQGEDGPTQDSAELHAWAEAFLPGAGWIGLDPTSGLLTAEGHIPLVCTPDAAQAAPISGTAEPSDVVFSYSISVRRVDHIQENTNPLDGAQWDGVRDLAHQVDAALQAEDVRLTMGGEPTFVGIDEPESAQWNIDALGALKRTRGLALIEGLRDAMAPGGLLHYGQGKWYPGEPLPRWALSCYWRADGAPVWENKELVAREDTSYGYSAPDAYRYAAALTRRLQACAENVLPAFDGSESVEPAGYVLPLRRRQAGGLLMWSTQLWFPRPERLMLLFGDSPIGYRISTDAVPWVAPDELSYEFDEGPNAERVRLPAAPLRRIDLFGIEPKPDPLPAVLRENEGAPVLIRPALCVQARHGRMHVFVPFTPVLADYLDLISAIEDTSSYLKMPVWIEGYAPAPDPRLRSFSVTPDPGVLEINLPPTSNWDELEHVNTLLDKEARRNRLTSEKFNYDGGRLATGGGSHIVAGAASVMESPFLRRPSLLRSMVAFWQNHPSLSYLFSGLYVGPTSQYPRVDEARMDALYELDVAFNNLPEEDCPPSAVDGLFRNLLVDVTGNSHRAEFCVDKLYPPDGHGLKLGLLELRAFEMMPDVRMSLLQMLLVRALIAMFWKMPFNGDLIRWGTALHDRFMLPEFVRADLAEVLGQLGRAGFAFDLNWFGPHFEFRFPKIGSLTADGVELELRHALEPWNVLAEEALSGGTVRTVDSSLERLQVSLSGFSDASRYAVTCNGRRVPLQATKDSDVLIAGVRYRARRLSSSLHPTIPVHAPLEFHLIDRWTERSVAQCTYYVGRPDGSPYPGRPADGVEAAARREERFKSTESVAAATEDPEEETSPLFPMTLDLRLPPRGRKIGIQAARLTP
jgi:uncharacterized protein (DUF2126 family)/transglutaminase-like putative cysteine protease